MPLQAASRPMPNPLILKPKERNMPAMEIIIEGMKVGKWRKDQRIR